MSNGYGTVLLPVHELFDEKIVSKFVSADVSTKVVVATREDESPTGIPLVNRFVPVHVLLEFNTLLVDIAVFTKAQFAPWSEFVPTGAVGNELIPVKVELPARIAPAVMFA